MAAARRSRLATARLHEPHLEVVSRRTIGFAAMNFGVVGIVTRFYQDPTDAVGIVVWLLAGCAVISGVVWMTSRVFVDGVGARVFGLFADLGTLAVICTISPRIDAVIGCALYSVTGAFFMFFLSRPWLVAHIVFATVATIGFTAWALADGEDVAYTLARTIIVLLVVIGPTLTMELAWSTFRRRSDLAATDSLTGVHNLRGMWQEAIPMIERVADAENAVAFAVADIDGFKKVNDAHGHDIGDEVLVRVAHELSEHVGTAGFVARSGGEEFTLVVSGPAETVREIAATIPTEFDGGAAAPSVTMSIGVVAAHPARSGREAARDARRRADHTMYEAKQSGGNQIRLAL
ncbi:sensor domain-containing diguanylate cyclase [Williamsia herbipolensis]|uniref:GGDEF domain-containing protein n=1 Tax=Williamsia herbipolensis TaxID=1603258 RepID=UPI0009E30668|nr:GGDEF domain-containing protein [Williamsia herbipolensis]